MHLWRERPCEVHPDGQTRAPRATKSRARGDEKADLSAVPNYWQAKYQYKPLWKVCVDAIG